MSYYKWKNDRTLRAGVVEQDRFYVEIWYNMDVVKASSMIVFLFISIYFMPILAIIFCLNLVTIIKKVKNDEHTIYNTFWLTFSFVLIVWSIAVSSFAQ